MFHAERNKKKSHNTQFAVPFSNKLNELYSCNEKGGKKELINKD